MSQAIRAALRPIEQGDIAAPIQLPRLAGGEFSLIADQFSGDFNILVLLGHDDAANATEAAALLAESEAFEKHGAKLYFLAAGGKRPAIAELVPGEAVLMDGDGKAYAALGQQAPFGRPIAAGPTVILVAPNRHILRILGPDKPDHAATLFGVLAAQSELRAAKPFHMHPPVLLVPDVFSPADCAHLMSVYAMQGQEYVEPGHNRLQNRTTDCKMRIPEYGRGDRIDHWVINPDTQNYIDERVTKRLLPEIFKAFHYRVTRHERYRIACYEGERGGRLHGHRDNTDKSVAYRRFAVTINLNSDQYEGGEVWFPEFSEQSYKPPAGSAVVFSCSLLHEVLHMRKGRRFALLGFLFGET